MPTIDGAGPEVVGPPADAAGDVATPPPDAAGETARPAVDAEAEGPPAMDMSAMEAPRADAPVTCAQQLVGTGTGLQGAYFPTPDLTGTSIARVDPVIDFSFPQAPVTGIGADRFSVRWLGQLEAKISGAHTIFVRYNDGVRLFIDERVVIYRWGPHNTTEESAVVMLEAGRRYAIRLEFYDNEGAALIELAWQTPCAGKQIIPTAQLYPTPIPPRCPDPVASNGLGTGLAAEYFNDLELTASAARRTDAAIDFTWSGTAPVPGVAPTGFSVRWRGQLRAPATTALTLHVLNDDGARLYVGGKLLADGWTVVASPQEIAASLDVEAGQRLDLVVEYHHEGTGTARVRLGWSWPCRGQELVPTTSLTPAP